MRTALVLILFLAWPGPSAWARACANLLYSPAGMDSVVTKVEFDRAGERAVAELGMKIAKLHRYITMQQGLTLIDHPDGGEYGVLFNPNPQRMDKGYVLRGERVDGLFVVHSFYVSTLAEDLLYYPRVAEIHGVQPRRVQLKRALLKCPTLILQAATQVKLWLKHRLPISDVVDFLNAKGRSAQPHRGPYHGKNRFVVNGRDRRGRTLRVVIQDEGLCPNSLITAYEVEPEFN